MDVIKVLIVDDHTLMRTGLKLILSNRSDIEVIGEAGDGEEAIKFVEGNCPDVVLLDISMPVMGGLDCLKVLKKKWPQIKVILLTMYEDTQYLREGLASGAMGYILKKAADDTLYHAIKTVYSGAVYIEGSMGMALVSEPEAASSTEQRTIKNLSDKERIVLELIALGHSNAEIAQQLFISVKTVETYKYRIMEKLGAKKRSDLVKYAMETGTNKV